MILVTLIILWSIALVALFAYTQEWRQLQAIPWLKTPALCSKLPFLSVVIPARNEAPTIGRCLDGILQQDYPHYEVIVVDDASTDATPQILADYAQHYPHLHVLGSSDLPPGWTGKANACQQAATTACGEWLLFIDADTVPRSGLLTALVVHSQQATLDLLSLFPQLEMGSFWERLVLPSFRTIIYATYSLKRANALDARPDEVVANGQCLFVRRAAYLSIGGHAAVREAVLEDMMLARTLHQAGWRTGIALDRDHIQVRMYQNGRDLFEGLTKNGAAGLVNAGQRAFWAGLRQFVLAYLPLWLSLGGSATALWLKRSGRSGRLGHSKRSKVIGGLLLLPGCCTLIAAWAMARLRLRQLYQLPLWYTFLWPIGLTCYGLIVIRSLWRVRTGRGVVWKGRTYVGT